MAKYKGSVELISGITQKNGGKFPLMDASAIQVDDNDKRLNEILEELKSGSAITSTDYSKATNKPRIEGIELVGDKSLVDLGILDKTLKVENKVADAKAVGDKIDALDSTVIKAIKVNGVGQELVGGEVNLPAYPTKDSLGLQNVENTIDAQKNVLSATKLTIARNIELSGDVSGTVKFDGSKNVTINTTIPTIDAGKITTGTIDIERLPKGALERCVVVANDTARFALTTDKVQLGDTVKVTETNIMYFVKDEAKLDSEEGYEVYTAGTATSVNWSGVIGKPEEFKPEAHKHTKADITDLFTVENAFTSASTTNAISVAKAKETDDKVNALRKEYDVTKATVDTLNSASHTHSNQAELDKIIVGKVAEWDSKAEGVHKHTKSEITDMFSVVDNLTSADDVVNALSANQGKVLNDKITVLEGTSHTHANKGELDKITDGKVAKWDSKAEGTHTHTKSEITDMFEVIDTLASDSTTDALSAKQGKELKAKIDAIHTHTNKEELDKITSGKVVTWDAKETTVGSQEKATKALNDAKEYANTKFNELVANPCTKISIDSWTLDDTSRLYKATVKHNFNTENVMVEAFGKTSKSNELISYKIIDANTVEVMAEDEDLLDVLVIGEGVKMVTLANGSISDVGVGSDTTWSSQKIQAELEKINKQLASLQ